MTGCQRLLKDYAETGSEPAFRELVGRYVNLVYSTALRLVGGDVHLAQDVSQTVFIGLARRAGTLSRDVMLGGWLHRYTFHVATKAVRRDRRRQARERTAMEMNTLHTDPEDVGRRVRPILDGALMRLGPDDHRAILLRFFEEQDFRAVGTALNISEDAARMRVVRAVEKLRGILTRRGVVLTTTGLSTVLGLEAVKAAPSGLVAELATAALAGPAAGGIISTLFFNIMNATKIKVVAGIVVAASVITSLVIQQRAAGRIREWDESTQQQAAQSAKLSSANDRLSDALAGANTEKNQLDELRRLRFQSGALRQKTNELTILREEQRRLRAQSQNRPKTPLQDAELRVKKMSFEKDFLLASRLYENKNGRSPSGFDEAAPFLPDATGAGATLSRDGFQWVYQLPNTQGLSNINETLVICETDPSLGSDGRWTKVYGFADGHVQVMTMPFTWNGVTYTSFEEYESAHIAAPPSK